jgi:arylsulfatase A-like enzyme
MSRLLAAVAVLLAAVPVHAAKKPNVILFLTDDNGYGDHSCLGNPVLKTPNMDRLHSQSVRLTDFHVAPMCTPTRGQLMTGMDCLHNGASSVSAGRSMIHRGIPTAAEIFRAAGYRTAMYGKWHLGDSYPNLPHQRGFQDAVYLLGWGITSMADLWCNDYFDGRFRHNGVLKQYPGYCTDVFFDLTKDYIRECKKKDEPFFIYLPCNAAHAPHWVPAKYKKPYAGQPAQVAAFFGMIANLDENLGKLDEFLKQEGLFDDTILIYSNDNGGTAGVNVFNAGMRGRKTMYYEGGHRAVCFVRWPNGGFRKPSDIDVLTNNQDILATLIDLCGIPTPKSAKFDGVSLANLLRGKSETLDDRILVVKYGEQPNGRPLLKWDSAVMWNKWRLVDGKELFDLRTDPGQKADVADKHPDVVKKLRDHFEKWWAGIEPTIDTFEPVSVGADQQNPVTLSAADWNKVYCDNMQNLRAGKEANGPWSILVEKDGTYEIELRRWPREADAAIAWPVPAFKAVDGSLPAGKALPIAKARLKVADLDEMKQVSPSDKGVTFSVTLKAGQRLPLQTWFYDAAGKPLCGAYFTYVLRK